jgi:hypothetical protein
MGQILHRNATTTDAVRRGTLPSQPGRFKLARIHRLAVSALTDAPSSLSILRSPH